MKTIIISSLIFCSLNLFCQDTGKKILIGQKRVSILEVRHFIFTLSSDSSIIVEAYKDSKGQICYFDLLENNSDSYVPELLEFKSKKIKYEYDRGEYFFSKNNYLTKSNQNEDWVCFIDNKKIKLEPIKNLVQLSVIRNKSLLTYAYYFPDLLLGINNELSPETQIEIRKILAEDYTIEKVHSLNFEDFKKFLVKILKKAIYE